MPAFQIDNSKIPFLGYFFSHGLFSLLLWSVVLVVVVTIVLKIFRRRSVAVTSNDQTDSLELLKIRFAKGEIDKDEFLRMKQTPDIMASQLFRNLFIR